MLLNLVNLGLRRQTESTEQLWLANTRTSYIREVVRCGYDAGVGGGSPKPHHQGSIP